MQWFLDAAEKATARQNAAAAVAFGLRESLGTPNDATFGAL